MSWWWLAAAFALGGLLGCMRAVTQCVAVLAEVVRERTTVQRIRDEIWKRLDGGEET